MLGEIKSSRDETNFTGARLHHMQPARVAAITNNNSRS